MAYAGLDVDGMYELSGRAAAAVTRRLRGSQQDREDLTQDGVEWILSHQHKIEEWFLDPEVTDGGYGKTFKSVYHHILEIAQKEKAKRLGYENRDNFYYSVGMLRRVLPLFYSDKLAELLDDLTEELDLPDRDVYLDIERGLKLVKPDVRTALYQWFGEDRDFEDVANEISEAKGISNEAARKKMYRVVKKLQEQIGGERPQNPEGGRRAITNAQARAITAKQWD